MFSFEKVEKDILSIKGDPSREMVMIEKYGAPSYQAPDQDLFFIINFSLKVIFIRYF